jgi:hypothetical protein
MNDVDEIGRILNPHTQALRKELQELVVPGDVEASLLTAFEKRFPKRSWWQRWAAVQWRIAGGVAASALAVMVFVKSPVRPDVIDPAVSQLTEMEGDMYEDIPFVALNSGEEILKQDSMRIVRADVPHTMLAAMGVTVNPQVAGDSSRAEMLVGANEEYLAVRFLPN